MSRRLLQRGRYPKDNSMYQSQATNKLEPAMIPPVQMPSADVPLYNTHPMQQSSSEHWQPQFDPIQQQPQMMQQQQLPVQSQLPMQNTWPNDASYSLPGSSENSTWNWNMENKFHPPSSQLQTEFQQLPVPSQQTQHPITTPTQTYSPASFASQPLQNNHNYDYAQQNTWYTEAAGDSKKQNGNQTSANPPVSAWGEMVVPNVSQPDHLQWTYNVPQNVPAPYGDNGYMQNLQMPIAAVNQNWNSSSNTWQEPNAAQNYAPSDSYVTNSASMIHNSVQDASHISPMFQETKHEFNNVENLTAPIPFSVDDATTHSQSESESGSLSAFFHHSIEDNAEVAQDCNLLVASTVLEQSQPAVIEDNVASLKPVDPEMDHQCDNTMEVPNPEEMQSKNNCYVQHDVSLEEVPEVPAASMLLVAEDSPNQEVPEPNLQFQANSYSSSNKVTFKETVDEPPNQQVPVPTQTNLAGALPDRSSLSPEDNAPPISSSSVQKVIQKELNALPPVAEPEKVGLQEVNLETIPDNLERPPDHDEIKKDSSLSATFRQHLRAEKEALLDLSRTSLWDEPHVPHVLLVPAAPVQTALPVPAQPLVVNQTAETCTPPQKAVSLVSVPPSTSSPFLVQSSATPTSVSPASSPVPVEATNAPAPDQQIAPVPTPVSSVSPVTVEKVAKIETVDAEVVSATAVLEKLHINVPATSSPSLHHGSTHPTSSISPIGPPSTSDTSVVPDDSAVNSTTGGMETKLNAYDDRHPISSSPLKETRHTASTSDVSASHPPFQPGHSRSYSDMRARQYPPESNYPPQNDHDHYRLQEMHPDSMRSRHQDNRYSSFEERSLYEKDSSRPSSRMSLDESMDSQASRDQSYRKHYHSDYDRPPSRMSESGAYRNQREGSHRYGDPQHSSRYGREEGYYQGGYRGYEYDPYQQTRQPYYGYYDPYRYNYNSYNYGFYDELYRNDPRYRKQVEDHYREYYKRYGYETEYERSSAYSGRSSTNEITKDTQRYVENDGTSSDLQYPATYEQQSQFSTSSDVSEGKQSAARLTPSKFSSPHAFAHFSTSGQLITVTPTHCGTGQPPLVQIHDMQMLTLELDTYKELKSFQGPLVRRETHKGDIMEFCQQKVQFYKQAEGVPDRESYILLWELLILLLRQNGSVAGSDIAELLLKNHEVLRPSLRNGLDHDSYPAEAGDVHVPHVVSGDASSPDEGIVVTRDKTILNSTQSFDLDKVTRKFREFLLFGHKKDALEWAMKHALWGHALFLASKMDIRTYANVMTRFANSLALNDPLQTLYQLMSGRQPAAVTCIADKQWGDWRPHLAMILSNPSANSDVDLKSITTLGDTLAGQGCLPATHFCYLMAQVEFGAFSCKSSKMVLLCANHHLPFELFATNEAIQCTEIYEYAQSLANPGFILPHLQTYKFVYAKRLLDHGFVQEALHYCEVLTSNFVSNPALFPEGLISQVHEFASKLKYHDPHYLQGQGELVDQEDPDWLKSLATLVGQDQGNVQLPATDYYGESVPEPYMQPESYQPTTVTNEEPVQETPATEVPTSGYYNQPNSYSNLWVSGNILDQQPPMQDAEIIEQPVTTPQVDMYPLGFNSTQWNVNGQMPHQEMMQEQPSMDFQQPFLQTTSPSHKFNFYSSEKTKQPASSSKKERTSSTSSLGMMDQQRDRRDSTLSSGSDYGSGTQSHARGSTASDSRKPEEKSEKARAQVGRSWLGGIFSKFLPKAPNQMILPDDKNPTIVWDSVNNRWVNTDANDDDLTNQPLAPPKDIELTAKTPPEAPNTSSMPPVAAASSPLINRFQRPKVKGMRQNYVDILNATNAPATNKPDAAPDALFQSMPFGSSTIPKVFTPMEASLGNDQPVNFISSQQNYSATQGGDENVPEIPRAPPMFDPAEFDSRRSSMNSVRHSVGPARRTYPT